MTSLRIFTEHPRSVGETYLEHMRHALGFGVTMLVGGMACLVHAILPFAFETTASRFISQLHHRMVTHRTARSSPATARERVSFE